MKKSHKNHPIHRMEKKNHRMNPNPAEASEGSDDDEDDDPMLWTKETLVRGIKFAHKKYLKLSKRYERLQEQIEKLTTDATKTKVKYQVALASKTTLISNLRNQMKIQSESKAVVRQSYENKYREDIDLLKSKLSQQRKRSNELTRNLAQSEKSAKQACTEKEIIRRKLTSVNLDYVEKNKEVTQLKQQKKKLKRELTKKASALNRIDESRIQAQLEIEKQRTERKKLEEQERTARMLMEQKTKDMDYEKKKELAQHNSDLRIQEKAKVRLRKEEEDKVKLKEQQNLMDSHLVSLHRSAAATQTTLPNNGQFLGGNKLIQLLQQHQLLPPDNNLPSMLSRLGGGSGSGSGISNDDVISVAGLLVTQAPIQNAPIQNAYMSPPARQLTLTQMERERTPPEQPLPVGVQKLTDDASGETYYMARGSGGSKNFYMSYDEMMEAVGNEKTGESTAPRRRRTEEANSGSAAANVTPATTFDSQMSDLTMTQPTQQSPWSHQSLDSAACQSDSAACQSDTEEEEEEF